MSKPVRKIIMLDGSHFLTDALVKVISQEPGLEIVATVKNRVNLVKTVNTFETDWIVLVLSPGETVPDIVNECIQHNTSIRLLTLQADGKKVVTKWYEPHEVDLGGKDLHEVLQFMVAN